MNQLLSVLNKKRATLCLSKYSIVVLIFQSAMLLFSCQTKVSNDIPPDLLNNTTLPSVEALNFETYYADSGVVKYYLKTPKLQIFDVDVEEPCNDFPEGFIMKKFDSNKKVISELSGNHGKYFINAKRWEATGNVVLVNSEGDTLKSEELKYHEAEDLIFSEQFVSIKKGDQYFNGSGGFKSNSQMTWWSFIKASGHLYVEDNQ